MKSREEIMEILEAFDLTGSFRDAAELAGCSHHTVAAWVAKREAGQLPVAGETQRRERKIDPFLPKVEEWVERSLGKIRADVVFRRLRRLGVHRLGPHGAPGGRRSQAALPPRQPPGLSALDPRAGHVGPVGLGRGAPHRGSAHQPVLCLAGLEPPPGGDPDLGPHPPDRHWLSGPGHADLGRGPRPIG